MRGEIYRVAVGQALWNAFRETCILPVMVPGDIAEAMLHKPCILDTRLSPDDFELRDESGRPLGFGEIRAMKGA